MADGNGRISRFLVNDVLRRDGAVPAPFILPISGTITDSTQERAGYDRALERFFRPLMRKFGNQYHFGAEYECEDGVRTNFSFDAYDEALAAWRYPELTSHSDYIGNVVRLTIEREMSKEAAHLRAFERAREAVKNHLEGPNTDIDHIIRSLQKDSWVVSNKLIKEFSPLADPARAKAIADAVREVFEPPSAEADEDDVEFPASKP